MKATEQRLIDANALADKVDESKYNNPHPQGMVRVNHRNEHDHFLRMIMDAPTVEAVEVVHARWVPIEYDGYADGSPVWDLWECSECREEHSGDEDTLTPYCPNCGAKMDGGIEDGR